MSFGANTPAMSDCRLVGLCKYVRVVSNAGQQLRIEEDRSDAISDGLIAITRTFAHRHARQLLVRNVSVVSFGDMRFGTTVGVCSDSSAALDDEYAAKPTVISDTTETRIQKFTLDPCLSH